MRHGSTEFARSPLAHALMLVLLLSFLLVSACTPPRKQAERYVDSGMALLEAGDPVKASLEFRNALQIEEDWYRPTYGLALVAERQENWDEMLGLLNRVISQQPTHWQAHLKRGQLLLGAGMVEDALAASSRVLELAPDDTDALVLHAAVLLQDGQIDRARTVAEQALGADPGNVEALALMANERLAAGEPRAALAYLDRGDRAGKPNIGLTLLKAQILEEQGLTDQAEGTLRELIQDNPEVDALYPSLAAFYQRQGRSADAESELRRRLAVSPGNSDAKMDLVQLIAELRGPAAAGEELEKFIAEAPDQSDLKFLLVQLYSQQGQDDRAAGMLSEVISAHPGTRDELTASEELATLRYVQGEKKEAADLVRQTLGLEPHNQQGLFLRAALALENRKPEEAIADLRTLLKEAPSSARANLMLGEAYRLTGRPQLAEDQYKLALAGSQAQPLYGVAYAEFLIGTGRLEQAEAVLEQTLSGPPADADALLRLARLKMELGDWSGALAVADRIEKSSARAVSANLIRGAVFGARQQHERSVEAYQAAYQASTEDARALAGLVSALATAGKADQAGELLQGILEDEPENGNAAVLLGQLHLLEGDQASAVARFEEAIGMSPRNPAGYRNLARLHSENHRFEAAEKTLAQGRALLPDDQGLRMAHAELASITGRSEEAILLYESLLKQSPGSDVIANNLAALLTDARADAESHERAYQLAMRFRNSNSPYFRDTLGWASYRKGEYGDAISLLEDVISIDPDQPLFRYHLGMSYLATEDLESARQHLELALASAEEQPFAGSTEARAALAQIAAAGQEE